MTKNPSLTRGLARAATLACPRCGSRRLFRRWLIMEERCPRCDLRFEQSEGYWLGSVAINLGVTEALFLIVFILGMVVTWPDVPWTGLLIAGVAISIMVPLLFHPFSRMLWVAGERHISDWSETSRSKPIVVTDIDGE